MRFDFVILHVPGKTQHITDALSRAPMVDYTSGVEDIEQHVRAVDSAIPASNKWVDPYLLAQEEDATFT